MKRVAVTGSTGFVGRRLVECLLKRGHIVHPIDRKFKLVECDVVYHLACPGTSAAITEDPVGTMDAIVDLTRQVIDFYPNTPIVYASSMGASRVNGSDVDLTAQNAYNVAKLCAETYLRYSNVDAKIYRLPSVYGEGMAPGAFIQRCLDKTAYYPFEPKTIHYIAHIDDVVNALIDLKPIPSETITLGDIYEQFTSGRRGVHRPASSS